jgi:hypothetical protein
MTESGSIIYLIYLLVSQALQAIQVYLKIYVGSNDKTHINNMNLPS